MRRSRRLRRAGALLASAGVLAAAVAGCGGDDSAPPTSTLSTPANAGSPAEIDVAVPEELKAGRLVAAQSGCLACHLIGGSGNDGPGPELTDVGTELSRAEIAEAVVKGPGIMPGYEAMKDKKPRMYEDLVAFLAWLGTE